MFNAWKCIMHMLFKQYYDLYSNSVSRDMCQKKGILSCTKISAISNEIYILVEKL